MRATCRVGGTTTQFRQETQGLLYTTTLNNFLSNTTLCAHFLSAGRSPQVRKVSIVLISSSAVCSLSTSSMSGTIDSESAHSLTATALTKLSQSAPGEAPPRGSVGSLIGCSGSWLSELGHQERASAFPFIFPTLCLMVKSISWIMRAHLASFPEGLAVFKIERHAA